jgi:hypothetical protein
MATKEELVAQAIDKARMLEVEAAELRQKVATLEIHCADLRTSEKDQRDLLTSLKTIKWLFQYICLPLIVALLISVSSGLIWFGRLHNQIGTLETNFAKEEEHRKKIENRLEETRDQVLRRHFTAIGTFVKIENNRLFLKRDGSIKDYGIDPQVMVFIDGERKTPADLREGMELNVTLANSINNRPFVTDILSGSGKHKLKDD